MSDRYDATGNEAAFEPGSDGQVLANKLGITLVEEMADLELDLLAELYERVLGPDFPERRLRFADIEAWHRRWLGNVYPWAGRVRQSVNLVKDGFMFAPAVRLGALLEAFEARCLGRLTPCFDMSGDALARAIAEVHVELILIHPFREGNGRLSRLLADVMAVQGGCGTLDYTAWDEEKSGYFAAIQHGMSGDYVPMTRLVRRALGEAA